jgi:zinc D-Ala-D-Ala carboxypeptidase
LREGAVARVVVAVTMTGIRFTPHFSLDELTFSSTACRLQIPNDPPDEVVANLRVLAEGLERVRAMLGDRPLHIDSGYRCPKLNQAVCGAPRSAHLDGWAADFICPEFGEPIAIVRTIAASWLDFDQVIQEGTWVHISFDPKHRKQVLTAHFGPNGTTYSAGV